MKRLFFISQLFLAISCSNNSTEKITQKESITITSIDSSNTKNELAAEETKPSLTFTTEDSIIFYNSIAEEAKIIDKFCKCAKSKGNTNIDCKEIIKKLTVQQRISDDIRNKYFNNSRS